MIPDGQQQRIQNTTLVAAPWPLFNRPSIQIGVLKAYLDQHLPSIQTDARHLFLSIAAQIGYKTYQSLSRRTWLAESIYAAMLYPQRRPGIQKMYLKYARQDPVLKRQAFPDIVRQVKTASSDVIKQVDWSRVDLVGFSVSLCQLTAALYFINKIKRINPDILVVVGGSTFCGPSSQSYLDHFKHIDFIVNGEGETPLVTLISALNSIREIKRMPTIPGIVSRHGRKNEDGGFRQIPVLQDLPCPDFDDYFERLEKFIPEKRFFPTIPVEGSRGCWWQRSKDASSEKGCAFCNLNLQWEGYRRKASFQVAQEIEMLTDAHQTLSVAFMDNVMPVDKGGSLFREIDKLNKNIKLFGEIRANTSIAALGRMKTAGMQEIQVGIESLSTRLLKKMNKGTRVIQNLEIMKHCETLGLKNVSNLILRFPGSDDKDVSETLQTLKFVMPFQPLKPVRFWLGLESPVWRNHRKFNIKAVYNHPGYRVLFPETVVKHLEFIIQTYRGDLTRQRKAWRPVEKKINQWNRTYTQMHSAAFSRPILNFQDGGTFLIINQRRHAADTATHRLTGLSREIYLFCQTHCSINRILSAFPSLTEDKLMPFLRMMTAKRLMYTENDRYLSLASPVIL